MAMIVRTRNRMNRDIQTSVVLSEHDSADCPSRAGSGDELADTVFVTVIALGVAEMVTTVLTIAVLVTDCTSVLVLVVMVVDVELMISVLVTTDVALIMSVTVVEKVAVLVLM